MIITGFIPDPKSAPNVVAWTMPFVNEGDEVEFLCRESWFGERTQNAAKEAVGSSEYKISYTPINEGTIVQEVDSHLEKSKTGLLVTCQFKFPDVSGTKQDALTLMNEAPCRTFLTLYGEKAPEQIKKLLFVTTGYVHDRSALKLLSELGEKCEWEITIAYIEEETGAKAGQSSEQTLKSLIHDIGLDVENFEIKVVVARMKLRGIKELFDGHDFVAAGMDAEGYFRHLESALPDATTAIIKRIPPLRVKSFIEWLPRINPSDHADLIHEFRQGSIWGPDFVVMLGLAAAVSSLGLIQDSPAVVIGSMLLAPLMTPIMGLGLALAQANRTMMRMSLKTIVFGFLLTVGVSFLVGIITPQGETLSEEVLSRGSPNVLDLMIALFAAAAAAFAMARPNIVGAIAGVAIATALVPPACSIGISFSLGDWDNGFGAALLFFTNLVAIIVASSFVFQFLGISASQSPKRHRRTAFLGIAGLVLTLLTMSVFMSSSLVDKINEGKNVASTYPVTRAVAKAVQEKVKQDKGVEVILMSRNRSEKKVVIQLASKNDLPKSYADTIRQIVRREMNDMEFPVQVTAVRSIWITEEEDK